MGLLATDRQPALSQSKLDRKGMVSKVLNVLSDIVSMNNENGLKGKIARIIYISDELEAAAFATYAKS